jgi:hypothetical protein
MSNTYLRKSEDRIVSGEGYIARCGEPAAPSEGKSVNASDYWDGTEVYLLDQRRDGIEERSSRGRRWTMNEFGDVSAGAKGLGPGTTQDNAARERAGSNGLKRLDEKFNRFGV